MSKNCPRCGRAHDADAPACPEDQTSLLVAPTAARVVPFDEPKTGQRLGVYLIQRRIATGGIGVIFEAEHLHLGRRVALKVLKPEMSERPDIVRRFFAEARAVNEIGHPNIVDIVDLVEDLQSRPQRVYMVMELLTGRDLRRHLRDQGALGFDEAVEIACQVAGALGAAHKIKIIHRDVKPENIFLLAQKEGEAGSPRIKLLDFGVVKSFGGRESTAITNPGVALGTPRYMAPEQILGHTLDERADIYSLGVVTYEMIAGHLPFDADNHREILERHVRQTARPPSSHRSEIPPRLEAVVMRCLDKHPVNRYRTMEELQAALRESLDRRPVAEGADPTKETEGSEPTMPSAKLQTAPAEQLPEGAATNETVSLPDPTWLAGLVEGLGHRRRVLIVGAGVLLSCSVLAFVWLYAATSRPTVGAQQQVAVDGGSPAAVLVRVRAPDAAPAVGVDQGTAAPATVPNARRVSPISDASVADPAARPRGPAARALRRPGAKRGAKRGAGRAIRRRRRRIPPVAPTPRRSGRRRQPFNGTVDPWAQ